MDPELLDALVKDIVNWTSMGYSYTVNCCNQICSWNCDLDISICHEHFMEENKDTTIQFFKHYCSYAVVFIAIENYKITRIEMRPTKNRKNNISISVDNSAKLINVNGQEEPIKIYNASELYRYFAGLIGSVYKHEWTIDNYFTVIPPLSSLQLILDDINRDMMLEEIIIEI